MRRAQEGLGAAQGLQREVQERLEQERLALLGLAGRIANQETQLGALAARREELRERHRHATAELEARPGAGVGARPRAQRGHPAGAAEPAADARARRAPRRRGGRAAAGPGRLRRERDGGHRAARGAGRQAQPPALARGDPAELRGLRPRRPRGDAARPGPRPARRASSAWSPTCSGPRRASSGPSRRRSGRGCSTCWSRAVRWASSCRATWPRSPRAAARSFRCRSCRSRRRRSAARGARWRAGVGRWTRSAREPEFRPVVELLLGNVLLVEDLEAAARVRDVAPGFTAVTLAGEVLAADGTLTGGVLEGPRLGGAAEEARDCRAGRDGGRASRRRYSELLTRHYALQKQMRHTEGCSRGWRRTTTRRSWSARHWRRISTRPREQLARFRERIGQLVRDSEALDESLARVDRDEEAARGESAHAQAERAAREDRARELQERLEGLQRSAEAHGQELMALRVKVASHAERAEAAPGVAGRGGRRPRPRSWSGSHGRRPRGPRPWRAARTCAVGSRPPRMGTPAACSGWPRARRSWRTGGGSTGRSWRGCGRTRRACATSAARLDGRDQGLGQITLRERSLVLDVEHLVRSVEERHQTDLGEELHRYHTHRRLEASEEQQLKELRGQVERMGEINLTAIEEHQEVAQRALLPRRTEAGPRGDASSSCATRSPRSTAPAASASRRPSRW